jgi:hypothetical protein
MRKRRNFARRRAKFFLVGPPSSQGKEEHGAPSMEIGAGSSR